MKSFTVTFVHERETKGTHRYNEVGDRDSHKIGAIYVKKSALNGSTPKQIVVTVEAKE